MATAAVRKRRKKKLKWGKTPWDKLRREDMKRELIGMFVAIESAVGVLAQYQQVDPTSPFWSEDPYGEGNAGRGWHILEACKQVLAKVKGEYTDESLYYALTRYARDVAFGGKCGMGWHICDTCGNMWGSEKIKEGDSCSVTTRAGKASARAPCAP